MSQLQIYQGNVTKVEKTSNGKWVLIFTKHQPKPVALLKDSYVGEFPPLGSKISVEANEGAAWFFGQHRTLIIDKDESFFPTEGLPNYIPSRNEMVCSLIMGWLCSHQQICSDDIYSEAIKRAGKADPRFIGHGFRILSKEKKIHKVGTKKSSRVEFNHARDISVWELTLK